MFCMNSHEAAFDPRLYAFDQVKTGFFSRHAVLQMLQALQAMANLPLIVHGVSRGLCGLDSAS